MPNEQQRSNFYCYFYSESREKQVTASCGESRYIEPTKGRRVGYTESLLISDVELQKYLISRIERSENQKPLTEEVIQILRPFGIVADSIPVCISTRSLPWGIHITDPSIYHARPEHAYMDGGPLPTRPLASPAQVRAATADAA